VSAAHCAHVRLLCSAGNLLSPDLYACLYFNLAVIIRWNWHL